MNAVEFLLPLVLVCTLGNTHFVGAQVTTSSSISINQSNFSCGTGGDLICYANATTTQDGELKLTPDPRDEEECSSSICNTCTNTNGVALLNRSVQILDPTTQRVASLNISFSFRIEAGNGVNLGDGMAFVMSDNKTWVGHPGSTLGAFRGPSHTGVGILAVEFDTRWNLDKNTSANHVGIVTNNTRSDVAKDLPFKLASAERVYAWVEYDSSIFEVRVSTGPTRPEEAFINLTKSLFNVFVNGEHVWVGFSGSNLGPVVYSYYTVYDLNFQSSFSQDRNSTTDGDENGNCKGKKSSVSPGLDLIAGVTFGIAATMIGGCLLLYFAQRRRRKIRKELELAATSTTGRPADDRSMGALQIAGLPRSYTYHELCEATKTFSDELKLGQGGFGSVYRGCILGTDLQRLEVAVKKLNREYSRQGVREFSAEVNTIGMIQHRNIVKLLGWCFEGEGTFLLVYEYMPKGSLDKYLYPSTCSPQQGDHEFSLSWKARLKILQGLAAALAFLHDGLRVQVIHRDVKSSNVMLDDKLHAVLGDFGLARMADHAKDPETTNLVAGTQGFMAPESFTGKYTVKTDVFAFGAVCLEVVCGRRAYDPNYSTDETELLDYVWRKRSEDELFSVVDRRLLEGEHSDRDQLETVLLLGLLCSHPDPEERPLMHQAVEILANRMYVPWVPMTKPTPVYYSDPHAYEMTRLWPFQEKKQLLTR